MVDVLASKKKRWKKSEIVIQTRLLVKCYCEHFYTLTLKLSSRIAPLAVFSDD